MNKPKDSRSKRIIKAGMRLNPQIVDKEDIDDLLMFAQKELKEAKEKSHYSRMPFTRNGAPNPEYVNKGRHNAKIYETERNIRVLEAEKNRREKND